MDADLLYDLKQFITATTSQQTATLKRELSAELRAQLRVELQAGLEEVNKRIDRLSKEVNGKIDDLSAAVADAMHTQQQSTGEQLQNHEVRISKLEAYVSH